MHEERKVRIYNIMIIRNPEPDDNKGQKGTRAGKVVSESTMRVSIHRIGASPYIHWLDSRPAARTRIWYAATFDLEYNPGNTRPALRCSVRSAIQSVHHLPTLCSIEGKPYGGFFDRSSSLFVCTFSFESRYENSEPIEFER